eukprot:6468907-Amphidinium_carterae.1
MMPRIFSAQNRSALLQMGTVAVTSLAVAASMIARTTLFTGWQQSCAHEKLSGKRQTNVNNQHS